MSLVLRVLCAALVVVAAAGDATLEALGGALGLDRGGACVAPAPARRGADAWRRCPAALVARRWAVARPSCLATPDALRLRFVRDSDGLTCNDVEAGVGLSEVRRVLSQIPRRDDLVLLSLDPPYVTIDRPANDSAVQNVLREFEPWLAMKDDSPAEASWARRRPMLLATPLRMLVSTIIAPLASFIGVFVFVVQCAGRREPGAYDSLEEKPEVEARPPRPDRYVPDDDEEWFLRDPFQFYDDDKEQDEKVEEKIDSISV